MPSSALSSPQGETDEPEDGEDHGRNPQDMQGEPCAGENQNHEQYE